ncbi:hypothetical protein [Litoreibacter albidus]|uniref:hypothetical protein n=1 Tax=Litoreibacter albidus TaxID=670155 RepID=UPI000B7E3A9D|nr:hypothetical protein [Litoreibacter albidus]
MIVSLVQSCAELNALRWQDRETQNTASPFTADWTVLNLSGFAFLSSGVAKGSAGIYWGFR